MSALITDEQRFLLLANGCESLQNPDFDSMPVVKLFAPASGENSACRLSAIRTFARRNA